MAQETLTFKRHLSLESFGLVGVSLCRRLYMLSPVFGTVSPVARIQRSRNQNMEIGVEPLTMMLSDPLVRFCF
jgi:hypothetical protein